MIDGVKIRIRGRDQQRLRSHHLLRWTARGPGRDGRPRYIARWGAFTFYGDETRCKRMGGSFHIQYHGGINWQDFTFAQFVEVVTSVCIVLGLHPANLVLSTVEVGVNIIPPIPTAEVLRCIIQHKTTAPVPFREGKGIEIRHAAYKFKIYDKALHYGLPGQLLRFEVAIRKMRQLTRYGVRTLSDLMEPTVWAALQGYALARFDELLILEPGLHPEGLRPAEVELLPNAGNPSYWEGMDKRRRSEKRKMLNGIYTRHAPDGLKATLRRLIVAKLEELNDGPTPDLCTDGVTTTATTTSRTFTPTGAHTTDHAEDGQIRTFAPYTIRGAKVRVQDAGDETAEVRHCESCGRDISGQRSTSKVCSERIYGKAGKACRNKLSNRSLTLRRMAVRGLMLFDEQPFVAVATSTPPQHVNGHP